MEKVQCNSQLTKNKIDSNIRKMMNNLEHGNSKVEIRQKTDEEGKQKSVKMGENKVGSK